MFSVNFYFLITERHASTLIVSSGDFYWKWFIYVSIVAVLLILTIRTSVGVIIDLNKVTIKNYLTRTSKDYFFHDIDDYVQYVEPSGKIGGCDIYLLKDKKIFGRIKAEYYSNTSELMDAIDEGIAKDRANRTSA